MWFQRLIKHSAATLCAATLAGVASVGMAEQPAEDPQQAAQTQQKPVAAEARPAAQPQQAQPVARQDSLNLAVNQRLQEELRSRDAIIRNLLERVQELEWRVNGGFTTTPKDMIAGGATAARPHRLCAWDRPLRSLLWSRTPDTMPKRGRRARRSIRLF